jgi:hypothetical protein
MSEFKYFRNTITGKVGLYPEDFGDLFYDTFIEVDSSAADCVDCWIKPEEDDVLDEEFTPKSFEDEYLDEDFPKDFPVVTPSTDKNGKDK